MTLLLPSGTTVWYVLHVQLLVFLVSNASWKVYVVGQLGAERGACIRFGVYQRAMGRKQMGAIGGPAPI
jgi:hypothetical protein